MGFLNSLLNIVATLSNKTANKIDKMSDTEIENKFENKTVEEMRNVVANAHSFYENRQNGQDNDIN